MSTAARLICNNIKNEELCPHDLLSNGVIDIDLLKQYHPTKINVSDELFIACIPIRGKQIVQK